MEARITKRLVDQVAPAERDLFVWDTSLRGFGLKVTPTGSRIYVVQYRMGGRSTPLKRLTIGKHGSPWTADQARTEAEKLLGQVAQGVDPGAERKEQLAKAFTVNELADRYVLQHLAVKNKPSTQKEFRRIVEAMIKPAIGRLAVSAVTRGDISALHHRHRDTPRQANLMLSILSKMFNLAEVWGFRSDNTNPCRLIERYRESKRERFLSDAEVTELGRALTELEDTKQEQVNLVNAVRLLLLTGCRLGELLALRWEHVDLRGGVLQIHDAKAGDRVHPIGALTMAFLANLPRSGKWVLSGMDPAKPLSKSTLEHAWIRMRTKAGLRDVRLHDLRHTVGTYAGQTGANAFLIRDKLGHKTLAMTGRYVNRDADPLRELSNKVEHRITAALSAGANIRDVAAVSGEAGIKLPEVLKHKRAKPS